MQFVWICQARECGYEERTFLARYCAWCGQDLYPTCMFCSGHIDLTTGQCLICQQKRAATDQNPETRQRNDLKSLLEHTLKRLAPLSEKSQLLASRE